jgi:hypothetical protein
MEEKKKKDRTGSLHKLFGDLASQLTTTRKLDAGPERTQKTADLVAAISKLADESTVLAKENFTEEVHFFLSEKSTVGEQTSCLVVLRKYPVLLKVDDYDNLLELCTSQTSFIQSIAKECVLQQLKQSLPLPIKCKIWVFVQLMKDSWR